MNGTDANFGLNPWTSRLVEARDSKKGINRGVAQAKKGPNEEDKNKTLFALIFAHLEWPDLLRASEVCREWRQIISEDRNEVIRKQQIPKDFRLIKACMFALSSKEQIFFVRLITSTTLRFFDSFSAFIKIHDGKKFCFGFKDEMLKEQVQNLVSQGFYCLEFRNVASSHKAGGFWKKIGEIESAVPFWFDFAKRKVVDETDVSNGMGKVALGGCFFPKKDLKLIAALFKKEMRALEDISPENWK